MQKLKAEESVEIVTVQFFKDEIIVNEGELIDEVIFQALNEFGFLSGESRTVQTAAIPIIFSVFLVLYILLILSVLRNGGSMFLHMHFQAL